MVYWVIGKLVNAADVGSGRPRMRMVERLGPFESREAAARARERARERWRGEPRPTFEIVCDFG
ncbi:hypothetical protein [Benzoatithermus flavus]|uniref:SPOR domain-containing protein n=1 Tax=Benzoatithermus flavus TaxID=3108223 RepID=A0ABU8XU00_9PROT